ncbi:PAS domain-containing protein [Sulfidibacter corallicola]|uniref:histidine kinase n=1 Tax=Sulfidibacter corallicola TaxID=2818388 RepID=A0A8A4TM34_SULCO|nr:sensor histidine kinase [Sulfidibacter corallicola]QTD50623.1 PAS domain-containing protein [Sulfidibacter corallicola]
MFHTSTLLLITAAYLGLLFAIASYAERLGKGGRSLVANPYVYTLSLAVYCTSWTFYGSVGQATQHGLLYLTIYLGPTLSAVLWWVVLRKLITIAREQRITTIADFIGVRYGHSLALSAIVTLVAAVGISPYLGLQIKAILTTFSLLTGSTSHWAGLVLVGLIALFAANYGVQGHDVSEKHEGLTLVVAIEAVVKLAAFLAVGLYVVWMVLPSVDDLEAKTAALNFPASFDPINWHTNLLLASVAIVFLPRQFHMAVVENHDIRHLRTAMWLFPAYLLLLNVFVLPVALAGLITQGADSHPETYVLTLPTAAGQSWLALLVFIGGFAAASGMIIVESLAIANMFMNSIISPFLFNFQRVRRIPGLLTWLKRLVIVGAVMAGYLFAMVAGESRSLVDLGLMSFEAVCIFAPIALGGLFWKGGNRNGALCGVIAGFAVWVYTLVLPLLAEGGWFDGLAWMAPLLEHPIWNPHALFGFDGLDRWTHALFWQLSFNIGLYFSVSLLTRQSETEQRQALRFVASYIPRVMPAGMNATRIRRTLGRYLGKPAAAEVVDGYLESHQWKEGQLDGAQLHHLREEAKRALSASLGSSIANMVFEHRDSYTDMERQSLLEEITDMSQTLRLSRQDLAVVNRQLAGLKAFRENIIESLPQGVGTVDELGMIRYWNQAMTGFFRIPADEALGQPAARVLGMLEPNPLAPQIQVGDHECRTSRKHGPQFTAHVAALTGSERGFVLILEDVSERHRMEQQLLAGAKHASIGRLAAGLSHEINNPLASISSLVQEMMDEPNSAFTTSSLETVDHHIDRISRILKGLGDFARLQPERKQMGLLQNAVDMALQLVAYDKSFKAIRIETSFASLPPIPLNGDRLQQLCLNLMLNARDAMPDGGTLTIRTWLEEGQVGLSFSDTGAGVSPDDAEHIFEPFFSTKGPRAGTGLGLSICDSIVKDHNGSIVLTRAPGGGACFEIRLPLAADELD